MLIFENEKFTRPDSGSQNQKSMYPYAKLKFNLKKHHNSTCINLIVLDALVHSELQIEILNK
mgnify:CR=1 FL=1